MFWNIFFDLCLKVNETPTSVVERLGISRGSVTNWKKGKVPQYSTLTKIADYFGVSVDYLMGNAPDEKIEPKKEAPADTFITYKSESIEKAAEMLKQFAGGGIILVEDKKTPPDEASLSEGERALIEAFRLVPEDQQEHVLELVRTTLKMQGLL